MSIFIFNHTISRIYFQLYLHYIFKRSLYFFILRMFLKIFTDHFLLIIRNRFSVCAQLLSKLVIVYPIASGFRIREVILTLREGFYTHLTLGKSDSLSKALNIVLVKYVCLHAALTKKSTTFSQQ